jgi:hypothetical protein
MFKVYRCGRCGQWCAVVWRSRLVERVKLPKWPDVQSANPMVCHDCFQKEGEKLV